MKSLPLSMKEFSTASSTRPSEAFLKYLTISSLLSETPASAAA